VIKAVLLGGATKPPHFSPRDGGSLDERLGVGVVNLDRSLKIFEDAPTAPGKVRSSSGWALLSMGQNQTVSYELEPRGDLGPFTVTAVWNRRIDGRVALLRSKENNQQHALWLDGPRLADFDLQLISLNEDGSEEVVAASESRVDNVEHVYMNTLPAGRYRLDLTRRAEVQDETYEVAMTWIIDPPTAAKSEGN
jgi:hypothetical protein